MCSGTVWAQGSQPAELPPEGFSGRQYIDSKGCIYLRETDGTDVNWVPRTLSQGEVMCGFAPTFPSTAKAEAEAPKQAEATPETPKPAEAIPETPKPAEATPETPAPTATTAVPAQTEAPKVATKPEPAKPAAEAPKEAVVEKAEPAKPEVSKEEPKPKVVAVAPRSDNAGNPPAVDFSRGDYIQIAAFAQKDNTRKTRELVEGLGLSVAVQTVRSKGKPLDIVFVGPFIDADSLKSALQVVRKAGYRDAFPRKK